jgi:hypothetical protein
MKCSLVFVNSLLNSYLSRKLWTVSPGARNALRFFYRYCIPGEGEQGKEKRTRKRLLVGNRRASLSPTGSHQYSASDLFPGHTPHRGTHKHVSRGAHACRRRRQRGKETGREGSRGDGHMGTSERTGASDEEQSASYAVTVWLQKLRDATV